MAAISYPSSSPRPRRHSGAATRPERHLRLIEGGAATPVAPGVYSRRRLVALVLAVLLLAGLATGARAVGAALLVPAAPAADAPTLGGDPAVAAAAAPSGPVHVVRPGDTVWSVARSLDPDGDIRATVDRLVARNGGATLQVGQRLALD